MYYTKAPDLGMSVDCLKQENVWKNLNAIIVCWYWQWLLFLCVFWMYLLGIALSCRRRRIKFVLLCDDSCMENVHIQKERLQEWTTQEGLFVGINSILIAEQVKVDLVEGIKTKKTYSNHHGCFSVSIKITSSFSLKIYFVDIQFTLWF